MKNSSFIMAGFVDGIDSQPVAQKPLQLVNVVDV